MYSREFFRSAYNARRRSFSLSDQFGDREPSKLNFFARAATEGTLRFNVRAMEEVFRILYFL
jgi:hypothetical protein